MSNTTADKAESNLDFDEVYGVVSDVDSEVLAVLEGDKVTADYEVEVVELDSESDIDIVEVDLDSSIIEGPGETLETADLWLGGGAENNKEPVTEDTEISEVNSEEDTEIDDMLQKPVAGSLLSGSVSRKIAGKGFRDKLKWSFKTDPLGNSIILLFLIFLVIFGIYVLKEIL